MVIRDTAPNMTLYLLSDLFLSSFLAFVLGILAAGGRFDATIRFLMKWCDCDTLRFLAVVPRSSLVDESLVNEYIQY